MRSHENLEMIGAHAKWKPELLFKAIMDRPDT